MQKIYLFYVSYDKAIFFAAFCVLFAITLANLFGICGGEAAKFAKCRRLLKGCGKGFTEKFARSIPERYLPQWKTYLRGGKKASSVWKFLPVKRRFRGLVLRLFCCAVMAGYLVIAVQKARMGYVFGVILYAMGVWTALLSFRLANVLKSRRAEESFRAFVSALDALFGDSPVFYRTVTNRQNRELADRIALLAKQADKDAVEKVAALLRSEGQTLRTPSQQRAVNFALNRLAQSVSLR